jgi:hypothetical protein
MPMLGVMESYLVTDWTRRHAMTELGVAAFSLVLMSSVIAGVAFFTDTAGPAAIVVAAASVVMDLCLARRCIRIARVMRRIHVRATDVALVVDGIKAPSRIPWADIARFEAASSSERPGARTQLSVYAVLHSGERVELEALRVDGLLSSRATKLAALEPYLVALERFIP